MPAEEHITFFQIISRAPVQSAPELKSWEDLINPEKLLEPITQKLIDALQYLVTTSQNEKDKQDAVQHIAAYCPLPRLWCLAEGFSEIKAFFLQDIYRSLWQNRVNKLEREISNFDFAHAERPKLHPLDQLLGIFISSIYAEWIEAGRHHDPKAEKLASAALRLGVDVAAMVLEFAPVSKNLGMTPK